jgi:ribosomal protein S18 acetylase RimI-like enzyme
MTVGGCAVRVGLRPMSVDDVGAFLARSRVAYVAELVAAGVRADEAERVALAQQAEAFPDGRPAKGHLVFDVVLDGCEVVGHLWLATRAPDDPDRWWVWDVEVAEAWRRRGVGRAVLCMAEVAARAAGGRQIGLSVFADNVPARRLYESLGYGRDQPERADETSIRLCKVL